MHKVKASLNKIRRKDREKMARDLKQIYKGNNRKKVLLGSGNLGKNWEKIHSEFVKNWWKNFSILTTFSDYPERISSFIYKINILKRANRKIKGRTKVVEVFSYGKAVEKLLYLIYKNLNGKWGKTAKQENSSRERPIIGKNKRGEENL